MPDAVHTWPVRVYYEDTDAGGVVYYANYLKFAERARTEILRAGGFDHGTLSQEHGIAIVVKSCAVDYLAPAKLDDALEVRSHIANLGGASFMIRQEIFRSEQKLAQADIRLVCVDDDLRPVRLPDVIRGALEPYKSHTTR